MAILDPHQVEKLLDRIERHRELAFKAYQRYTHRPGTITGNREYERFVRNDNIADQAARDLYNLIAVAKDKEQP